MNNTITVIDQRVVTIAGYPIDMFLGATHEVYFGSSSVRIASLSDSDWAQNAISSLMGVAMGIEDEQVLIDFGCVDVGPMDRASLLTKDEFKDCVFALAQDIPVKISTEPKKNLLENQIQQNLAKRFNCKREVHCPCGRVDLLSDEMLIEVKTARQWKSAVGQVLTYASYFPGRQQVIYLFDVPESFDIEAVSDTCRGLGITVMTEG